MASDRRPRRGIIFILSAPSGAGKTTISRAALKAIEGLAASVSLTTRMPREGEADGSDYHFVSEEEFRRRLDANELAESARVFDASYGTPRAHAEASAYPEYDYLIINADVDDSISRLAAVVEAERLKVGRLREEFAPWKI